MVRDHSLQFYTVHYRGYCERLVVSGPRGVFIRLEPASRGTGISGVRFVVLPRTHITMKPPRNVAPFLSGGHPWLVHRGHEWPPED